MSGADALAIVGLAVGLSIGLPIGAWFHQRAWHKQLAQWLDHEFLVVGPGVRRRKLAGYGTEAALRFVSDLEQMCPGAAASVPHQEREKG